MLSYISSSEQCWEVVDLSDCRIDDRRLTTLCDHISSTKAVIQLLNLSNNILSTAYSISCIIKLLQLCIVDEFVLSYNGVSDDALRDALLSEICIQHTTICNCITERPLIVINDPVDIDLQVTNDKFCSMYLINCRIDDSILQYPLQNNLAVGSLVVSESSDGIITTIVPFLQTVKVSTISIVQVDHTDEAALGTAMKLKEIVAVHQTIEEMQFVLLSQTHLLAYGTCEKQIKHVVLHYPLNKVCVLQINNCNLLDDGVLDAVLTNCSPDLYSIDVSGCSIRSVLLMYL